MPTQLPIDFDKAVAARDKGMRAATAHADAVLPTWSDRALAIYHQYATNNQFFTNEDVRFFAHNECGLETPTDARCWGTIPRMAAHRKWVRKAGKGIAKDPRVHCNEVTVWESLIYLKRKP
jgi:hypothetical protein